MLLSLENARSSLFSKPNLHQMPKLCCIEEYYTQDLSRTMIHAQAQTKALAWKMV